MTSTLISTAPDGNDDDGNRVPGSPPRTACNMALYDIEETALGETSCRYPTDRRVANKPTFNFDDLIDLSGGIGNTNWNTPQWEPLNPSDTANQYVRESNKRRQGDIERLQNSIYPGIAMTICMPQIPDGDAWTSSIPLPLFQQLIAGSKSITGPLWPCVLAIVWEFFDAPVPQLTLETMTMEEFVLLLTSAARYQMEAKGVGDLNPIERHGLPLIKSFRIN